MSTFKLLFALVSILFMVGATATEVMKFDSGKELEAIFEMTIMAFTVSFWAWLLILLKEGK